MKIYNYSREDRETASMGKCLLKQEQGVPKCRKPGDVRVKVQLHVIAQEICCIAAEINDVSKSVACELKGVPAKEAQYPKTHPIVGS